MLDAGPGVIVRLTTLASFVLAGLSWCRKYWNSRSHLPFPPGPPSLPVVGSIFSLGDPLRPWLDFNTWRSTYGWHNEGSNLFII
jgi:hypothetical protein